MKFKVKEDLEYYKFIYKSSDIKIAESLGIPRITLSRWLDEDNFSFSNLEAIYSLFFKENIFINRLKEEMFKSFDDKNSIVLFHGAKSEIIGNPSIEFSLKNKDFGKGFYLGSSIEQATSFVSTFPYSSVYV